MNLVSAAHMVVAVGCTTQQSADPSPQASSSSVTSPSAPTLPPTVSQFDARWIGVTADQPQGWEELNRRINGDFQQFSLRPTDETESIYGCNGCAP